MTRRAAAVLTVGALSASLVLVGGCGKKAPALTAEQLMAAIQANQLPKTHPLSMQAAQEQGCNCHTQAKK